MRSLAVLCLLAFASLTRAAPTPDPVLLAGLQACQTSGIEAGLRTWFADRLGLADEIKTKLVPLTAKLGPVVIDTEVVAIQLISKRVTRYYVAIYFERRPLWLRIERYENGEKAFYLPLRYSTNPDEILPGYVTELQPQ